MQYINGENISNTVKNAKNTADYVVARLVDLGIAEVFAVPGDFVFAIDNALASNTKLRYIGCCNELNASYAADGYARERGAAMLSTTYAVGELSALTGMMGAKAENNVIFHLVGSPSEAAVHNRQLLHHTLGDGIVGNFRALSSAAACVSAVITPDNAVREMNRVIHYAFKYRQPAYITMSLDHGSMPVTDPSISYNGALNFVSQPSCLAKAVDFISDKIQAAKSIVVLPSMKLKRYNLTDIVIKLIEHLKVPFVVLASDKSVISQDHPQYAGIFMGCCSKQPVLDLLNNADLVLDLGQVLLTDFDTAGFTETIDANKILTLSPLYVKYGTVYIGDVFLKDVMETLIDKVTIKENSLIPMNANIKNNITSEGVLTLEIFYAYLANFLRDGDSLIVEMGSSFINMNKIYLPNKATYHVQGLWGAIGWATPAAFGMSIANTERQTILVTGEGAHQISMNELASMGRYKIKPIIFCINNNGYTIERGLEEYSDWQYNNLAQLEYSKLPAAFNCDWLCFSVKTGSELIIALAAARDADKGVYIEIITDKYDYGDNLRVFNQHLKQLHSV